MVAPDGSSSSPEITLKELSVRRFVTHVEENPSAHQKGNTIWESIGTVVLCQSTDCKNQPINGRSSQGTVYHSNAPLPAQSFPASSPTCDATFLFTHDGCNITSISISKSKSKSSLQYRYRNRNRNQLLTSATRTMKDDACTRCQVASTVCGRRIVEGEEGVTDERWKRMSGHLVGSRTVCGPYSSTSILSTSFFPTFSSKLA